MPALQTGGKAHASADLSRDEQGQFTPPTVPWLLPKYPVKLHQRRGLRMERRLTAILAADMFGFSRLMEADEDNIIARQKGHLHELIEPEVTQNHGRIVKKTGDGLLAEFASAQDAVRCAINVQSGMQKRETGQTAETCIQYRVGINLGDVIFEDGDIFGDGVNVASRLEALAEPGGVCVSDSVHQTVHGSLVEDFRDLGLQRVKNISRAIRVWQWTPDTPPVDVEVAEAGLNQKIQFCTAADGTQIAYARVGKGPPLIKAPNWLNHIEYEWRSPVWGPAFSGLAKNHEFIRFDQRGNGLSDWDVDDISEDAMISDMATVVNATGLDKFALFGISQGCSFSIRYAAEHPEQVKCLVFLGGYLRGRLMRQSEEQEKLYEAASTMINMGWGSTNPAYRHFFTATFMPDASIEQQSSFDELQRLSITPENAMRIWKMNATVDVSELAKKLNVPTLVLHCEGDRMSPLEEGRRMAAHIPGARFVTLKGDNHALIDGNAAFDTFFEEVNAFLEEHNA
jgi:class 3 adenylate cyclase/pimeloyl-ACP methyl ester carboxylesterase